MCDKSISSAAAVNVYNMYTIVQRELLKNPFEEAEKEGFLRRLFDEVVSGTRNAVQEKEAELLTSKFQWQWKDDNGDFQDYEPMTNLEIKEAFSGGRQSVKIHTEEEPKNNQL